MMVNHYDNLEAKKTPKQQRFMDSLKQGRNEVFAAQRLKDGTGSSIAVGLKPTKRLSDKRDKDGKAIWEDIR